MSKYVTWLHLSDLHYCQSRTGWDAHRVLSTLKNDLRHMEDAHALQPGLIFFTGDAAFGQLVTQSGDSITDQFEGASRFLDEVRTAFTREIPRDNVFLVPGNHDANRRLVSEDQTLWLDGQRDSAAVLSLINEKPVQWHRYMERLADYKAFLQKYGYSHLLQDPDRLCYSLTRMVGSHLVSVVGLNSAWSCSRESEKGKLWMAGRWQIDHLLRHVDKSGLSIALMHHPPNWLVEYEDPQLSRQLARDFDFSLHGHEHQDWVMPIDSHVRIAAGATYEGSQQSNGYNFVRLDIENRTGEVWLRRYESNSGGWVPAVVFGKTTDAGQWRLAGLLERGVAQLTNERDEVDRPRRNRAFGRRGSDLPPVVDTWVGREPELELLSNLANGVAVITGIGGQGKSVLVAKFLENWLKDNPEGFWDWRDCREEADRFFTQLIAIMEHLTGGPMTEDIAKANTRDVVRFFFQLVEKTQGIIVLDNVDSYVNESDERFSLGLSIFIQEALRVGHNLRIILTCRPRVFYPSPRFLEIPLTGIELDDAIELFRLRGIADQNTKRSEIEEIWLSTEGHPLWLNLIAVQMARNPLTAPNILQELRKGKVDERTRSMFRALWKGLNERQRIVLRCMAEIPYPESRESIANFAASLIKSPNQFMRAFEGVKVLSLVVERGSTTQMSKFDLHPLVRSFVRTEYPTHKDRLPFIQTILQALEGLITGLSEPSKDAPLEDLQRWTAKAELELASGDLMGALDTLASAADQLIARSFHEEFFRVAKSVLEQLDWNSIEVQDTTEFHEVIDETLSSLVEHGRADEARGYLNRYEDAAENRTIARLRFCKVASYLEWFVGNFDRAITYAREGVQLRNQSGIDTDVDSSNTLALALRDKGEWDEALKIFAPDESPAEILSEDFASSSRGSSFYGNVGRCLQLKGELKPALGFYVRSAQLLRNPSGSVDTLNKGYAALWIGETLECLGDFAPAYAFYRQAAYIWSRRAPLRSKVPLSRLKALSERVDRNIAMLSDNAVDVFCRKWLDDFVRELAT